MIFWEMFMYHQNTLKILSLQYVVMFAVRVLQLPNLNPSPDTSRDISTFLSKINLTLERHFNKASRLGIVFTWSERWGKRNCSLVWLHLMALCTCSIKHRVCSWALPRCRWRFPTFMAETGQKNPTPSFWRVFKKRWSWVHRQSLWSSECAHPFHISVSCPTIFRCCLKVDLPM